MKDTPGFGRTAPAMSAEAAEKWRHSYRKYRHQKHQEKKAAAERAEAERKNFSEELKEKRKTFRQIKQVAKGKSFDKERHHSQKSRRHASTEL